MDKETAIEFVRRMIALSKNNDNENEVQVALAKCNEWITKYNLDLSEIPVDQATAKEYTEECVVSSKKMDNIDSLIGAICEEFWFVKRIRIHEFDGQWKLIFIGEKHNVTLARYVYSFLKAQFEAHWMFYKFIQKRQANESVRKADQNSYYLGLYKGFSSKMREQRNLLSRSQSTALVVLNSDLDEEYNRRYPSRTKARHTSIRYGNSNAEHAGYNDGRQINIHEGIGSNKTNQPRLT